MKCENSEMLRELRVGHWHQAKRGLETREILQELEGNVTKPHRTVRRLNRDIAGIAEINWLEYDYRFALDGRERTLIGSYADALRGL